ncbi:MAG: hypothetical protein ACE5I1_27260, partial [bacterium]
MTHSGPALPFAHLLNISCPEFASHELIGGVARQLAGDYESVNLVVSIGFNRLLFKVPASAAP